MQKGNGGAQTGTERAGAGGRAGGKGIGPGEDGARVGPGPGTSASQLVVTSRKKGAASSISTSEQALPAITLWSEEPGPIRGRG